MGERPTTVRLERVLAVGRALVATSLAVIYAHPAYPVPLSVVSYTVLATYALYSLLLLAHIQRSPASSEAPGWTIHLFDLLWIVALTLVHPGPVASFLVMFLFLVLASGYRWGFAGTMLTTCAALAVFLGDSLLVTGSASLVARAADSNGTVLAVASLLLTGSLVGYLGTQGKRARTELSALADIAQRPRVRLGVGGSVAAVSRVLARVFGATEVCFVVEDFDAREVLFWHLGPQALESGTIPPARELDKGEQREWLFPDPGDVWFLGGGAAGANVRARVKKAGVWAIVREPVDVPARICAVAPAAGMVVANIGLPHEWRGRIYLLAPARCGRIHDALRFLEALVDHAAPSLTNVFLLTRLRARVTAAERGRVARELHDGAIQSLLGLDMKVEALRRTPAARDARLSSELDEVQTALRQQVLELRTLMQALRPVSTDTNEQLPDVLASVVERFRRDSGISTRFVHAGGPSVLRTEQSIEVVRIVQEALVNVRRHSRARNVMVRLTTGSRNCLLVVEDDGIGLEFDGQLSGPEMELQRIGPAIIRERARLAGAHLTLESHPGAGLRIELMLEGPSS